MTPRELALLGQAARLARSAVANQNTEEFAPAETALALGDGSTDLPPAPSVEWSQALRQIVATEIARALASAQPDSRREGMNAEEVAEFLGVDRKTVYEYANRGRIPCRRLGKRLLFSRRALVAWLGSCETASSRRGGK